jgi:hypothetical protein
MAWELLVAATGPYVAQIVNAEDPDALSAGSVVDDEGDAVGVEAFIDQTLDLFGAPAVALFNSFHSLSFNVICDFQMYAQSGAMSQSSSKTVRGLVEQADSLQQLVGLAIALMQVTSGMMQQWQDDPNEFVAAEEDLESGFSVRAACAF